VRRAGREFPKYIGDGKWLVYGRGTGGCVVEVIYILDDNRTIYVIHAMPVTLRRRRGGK